MWRVSDFAKEYKSEKNFEVILILGNKMKSFLFKFEFDWKKQERVDILLKDKVCY